MKDFLEHFKEIKDNPEISHYLFKGVLNELPSWQAFIDYIEFSKIAGNYRSDSEGIYILHTDPTNHDLSSFGIVQQLRSEIREIYGDEIDMVGITLLISELSKDDTDGPTGITKHYDPQDTVHWACVGKSQWHIYSDETNEIEFEYIVEPGDVFFTRKHIVHDVESLSKRAACILTMHKDGETEYGKK